jgi:hypothetical protein
MNGGRDQAIERIALKLRIFVDDADRMDPGPANDIVVKIMAGRSPRRLLDCFGETEDSLVARQGTTVQSFGSIGAVARPPRIRSSAPVGVNTST